MNNKLSSKAIRSWIISRSIVLIILLLIYILVMLILPKFNFQGFNWFVDKFKTPINIISLIILGLTALSAFVEPFFEYKQWSYKISEDEIFFTEGIYFKKSVTIPIVRIQNINLSEGPINSYFNLATVKIGTAGGSYDIPNIDKEEVERIREFLSRKINENVREELNV
ncbi:PH domain-containing protein [Clostridium perfringens]|nr:PH domain-containing protein [Clostridium perfringens]